MAAKLGEVETKVSCDVKKTDELKVCLKRGLCNKTATVKFKPSEEAKKGDKIKITIEKL